MNRIPAVRPVLPIALLLLGTAWTTTSGGCGRGTDTSGAGEVTETRSDLTAACTSSSITVLDLQADFRDIWKGTETPDTGKQTDPIPTVGVDFSSTVQPSQVAAQFVPVNTDGTCGPTVPASSGSSVVASAVWGTATSDSARAPNPSAFNVFVRDTISGIVSAGGAVAAGGDVTLSSMAINGTVHQPVGLISGGKVTTTSGSISGNVTYGVQSTFPQTVTVSGTKSLSSFSTTAAFQDLASLSALLADETPNGTTTSANGNLQLTGSNAALNTFQVSADTLSQASFVQITVPANAAAIVNVTGNMSLTLQNKGLSLQGATAATLLWNIPAAAFVQISGISLQGSILAPRSLVTFDSGSLSGTLVAQAFISSGSGSLQATPLTVSKLFPTTTPSLVRLVPAQPLVRGCSYHFLIPATTPLTTAGGCLAAPIDVQFRVASSVVPAAGRELTNVQPDPALHTLRRFSARAGVNTPVDQVWDRYQAAIGIASSNLVPTAIARPSSTLSGQTVTVYQQYAQGYPVAGYGYFVATQSGIFRAANGKVMPGLPVFAPPAVTSASALQSALTYLKISPAPWVSNPSVNHAPTGQLAVVSKHIYPTGTDFVLAWDFRFGQGTGILDPAGVQVDATTGAVLAVDPGKMGLTPLPAQAKYSGQVSSTVDTIYNGSARPFSVASYQPPGQSLVTTLASGDIAAPGTLATVTGVTEDKNGNLIGTPQFIVDPTPLTPWVATDKVEQRMATLQWALELSNSFMQSLSLKMDGGALWQNIDGPAAHQQVHINYTDGTTPAADSALYSTTASTPDLAQIFIDLSSGFPLQAGTIAHEYTHALIDGLRRANGLGGAKGVGTLALYNEAASINEALADLFAISLNHSSPTQATPWFCIELDLGFGPECYRNISDPTVSLGVPLPGGQAGFADLYGDTTHRYGNYAALPASACTEAANNDRCGAHQNSTIISRWGYLLAMGTGGLTDVPCGLTFGPLDPNPDTALRIVLDVALTAVSTRTGLTSGGLISTATFADFRDATLQVASEMVDAGTLSAAMLSKIELAWDAVGLPPLTSHPDAAAPVVAPANLAGAYPWATFTWPDVGNGQSAGSWDFQLTTATFDTPTFHQELVTEPSADSTSTVLPLALPSNTSDTYYWRVRPASTSAWATCYPIYSFVGTTVPDPVNDLQIAPASLASVKGDVLPGVFTSTWDYVRGTVTPDYDFYIGTQNPGCMVSDGVTKISGGGVATDGVTDTYEAPFVSQPKTHYFLNVRPIGPPDFTGATTHGDCNKLEFDTADLLPPTVATGDNEGMIYTDHWTMGFNWTTSGGAVKSDITLYTRDANGDCGTKVVGGPYEVQSNCARSCDENFALPPTTTLPSPTGYCWAITDVAANGDASPTPPPTEMKKVGFSAFTLNPQPGALWADVFVGDSEGNLPGDSYGKPVTFSWTTLPNFASAPAYGFKIGRWFWPQQLSAPDPVNCVDGNTSLNLCQRGPTADTLFETVFRDGGFTETLPAAQAGKGRYCWGVWPIFDDPAHPGTDAAGPSVDFQLECYTTGPALPRINVPDGPNYSTDPNMPPPRFTHDAINGTVELDYIPDNQMKGTVTVNGGETSQFDTSACPVDLDDTGHRDVYDCKIPFSFVPQKDSTYVIDIQTFNGDQPAIADGATPLQHVVETITTGSCGETDGQCCDDRTCADPAQACGPDGKCVACGALGNVCCAGGACPLALKKGASQCGTDGTCELCGNPGQSCCQNIFLVGNQADGCNLFVDALKGITCQGGKCEDCGDHGNACCTPDKSPFPPCRNSGDQCIQGLCSNPVPTNNCVVPLVAPNLPEPALSLEGIAGCTQDDVGERAECIIGGGPASDLCEYFIPSLQGLQLGWPAVPGADHYRVTQIAGDFTLSTFSVSATSGNVSTGLQLLTPLTGTLDVCGFYGYGVAVTAINSCGDEGPTSLTGIGFIPQGP